MSTQQSKPRIADDSTGVTRELLREALARAVVQLLQNDAVLRNGANDDALHDARVAVRRLRADLRSFLPLLERDWACALRERLRWLGDRFGRARDADILVARLEQAAEALPEAERPAAAEVIAPFRAARDAAYAEVRATLDDERYLPLLHDVLDAATEPRFANGDAPAPPIAAMLADAWRAQRKAVRRRSRPASDEELHAIRIKTKRVRYAAEALAPLGGRRLRRLARAAERLQDILGAHHDAVVARDRLRQGSFSGETAFVAGELAALQERAAREACAAWRDAWRVEKKRWRRVRTTAPRGNEDFGGKRHG